MWPMKDRSFMELRCYAYRRGDVWEAICTDLDVAVFGSSQEEVRRSLAEAIDLHLEGVADLPDEDRRALFSRRTPWHVRLGLEVLSRLHNLHAKWSKSGKSREQLRRSFVVHSDVAVPS